MGYFVTNMSTGSQLLGEGAYAKVYDNKDYAIKITEIKSLEDLTAVAREQYILRMHLPNMVPYRSCYYKWGSMHLTLEKATYNLNQWYRAHTMISKEKIKDIARQLLQGVYSLHEHNVMHRDLKPDNVLLKGDVIWICDFGLSRQFANDYGVATGYMVTRWYRAPEIWRKEKYTSKVDMWSIGCIIHKLVHGKVPGKTLEEIQKCAIELKNNDDLDTLIKGLLMLCPEARWDAKRALAFMGEDMINTYVDKPSNQTWLVSPLREKWFRMFHREFSREHRVLAHALMLFDSCDQTAENMCSSMAVAAMLFKTRPAKITNYAINKLKALHVDPMQTIAEFIPTVCDGTQRLSEWESFEGSFTEYLGKMIGNNKKRKYFC
tara:strand:+ start:2137 stop:3267 length:1131 start_codon:yes stop_codon:yes gene_type:complete